MLQQQKDGTPRPIGNRSGMLTNTEQKLATIHKKILSIVRAVLLLWNYLRPSCFIILTTHEALKWLLTSADALGKLAKRLLRLLKFDIKAAHRACIKHLVPAALSRLKAGGIGKNRLEKEVPVLKINATKEQGDVQTKYFEKDQSYREETGNPMDNNDE